MVNTYLLSSDVASVRLSVHHPTYPIGAGVELKGDAVGEEEEDFAQTEVHCTGAMDLDGL